MAFNPFSAFQSNQKFWMAAVLLMTMFVFIFCTGNIGDMAHRIEQWMHRRGAPIAKVNGSGISREELSQLRMQRNTVNEFMLKCGGYAAKIVGDKIKTEEAKLKTATEKKHSEKDFEAKQKQIGYLFALQDELLTKGRQPRYFDLNVKLDDLIEFKMWQAQADRLGVLLTDAQVDRLLRYEFYDQLGEELGRAYYDVARGGSQITYGYLMRGVADEFRVRLAQLATESSQPWDYLTQRTQDRPYRLSNPLLPPSTRAPVSPAMMWDFYKSKRAEYNVALVPIKVNDFLAKVGTPSKADQEAYFAANREKPYDPNAIAPGLEFPAKARIAFVMADPTAPAYVAQAHAKLLAPIASPFLFNPLQPAATAAVRYVCAEMAREQSLQRTYDGLGRSPLYESAYYNTPNVGLPVASWLARRHPESAATFLGSLVASPSGTTAPFAVANYLAWGVQKHPEELQAGIEAEVKGRLPYYGLFLPAGSSAAPGLTVAGIAALLQHDESRPAFDYPRLPLVVVRKEMEDILGQRIAEEWARENMRVARRKLEDQAGKPSAFKSALRRSIADYRLSYGETQELHDRYSVGSAKELAPLKQVFLRYLDEINNYEKRDLNPETLLKEADFYKMFFGGEKFSAEGEYKPLPFPPKVAPAQDLVLKFRRHLLKVSDNPQGQELSHFLQAQDPLRPTGQFDLFAWAEKPALYWKLAESAAEPPKSLDEPRVRDRVTEGWQREQARTKQALPLARSIAEALAKTDGFFINELPVQAQRAGHLAITLNDVSTLAAVFDGAKRDYPAYTLPKGEFNLPRPDMAQQILQLWDLKQPIAIAGNEKDPPPAMRELDAINKALFDAVPKKNAQGKYVQVLTNRPMTEFYVAVVTQPPMAKRQDFFFALSAPPSVYLSQMGRMRFHDELLMRVHEDESKRVRAEVVKQLRDEFHVETTGIDAEVRKEFDEHT